MQGIWSWRVLSAQGWGPSAGARPASRAEGSLWMAGNVGMQRQKFLSLETDHN
jgi:hypothetical protein